MSIRPMSIRHTHTFAVLGLSEPAYREIRGKLEDGSGRRPLK
jgi:hypothetical protein